MSMQLYKLFLSNTGKPIHKNAHYFEIYERHFANFVGRPITLLEIGCGAGGSLEMWRVAFGPRARVVGIDIRPECQLFEGGQVSVRIGEQQRSDFLAEVLEEFGPPDIVIDDGSHQMSDVNATFTYLYPRIAPGGVYLIEDLHTAYWPEYGGGFRLQGTFIERCKDLIDELNSEHTRGHLPQTSFTQLTGGMHFCDSVVVIERGKPLDTRSLVIGGPRSGA